MRITFGVGHINEIKKEKSYLPYASYTDQCKSFEYSQTYLRAYMEHVYNKNLRIRNLSIPTEKSLSGILENLMLTKVHVSTKSLRLPERKMPIRFLKKFNADESVIFEK